ncbi:3902_t:CDS:1, partial [Funneliformis geosporum]
KELSEVERQDAIPKGSAQEQALHSTLKPYVNTKQFKTIFVDSN